MSDFLFCVSGMYNDADVKVGYFLDLASQRRAPRCHKFNKPGICSSTSIHFIHGRSHSCGSPVGCVYMSLIFLFILVPLNSQHKVSSISSVLYMTFFINILILSAGYC